MKLPLLCLILLTALVAQIQPSKTQKTVNEIRKTGNNVKSVISIGKEITGWIPKKKKKETPAVVETDKPAIEVGKTGSEAPTALKSTLVVVYGIDYPKLKEFNENIKACSVVESTVMKFNPEKGSTIKVSHKGTSENLLKLMGQTSKDIFSERNVASFEEGNIALKL